MNTVVGYVRGSYAGGGSLPGIHDGGMDGGLNVAWLSLSLETGRLALPPLVSPRISFAGFKTGKFGEASALISWLLADLFDGGI